MDDREIRRAPPPDPGLYIHIPFCQRKCPYCDFNTYAGLDDYFGDTVDALCHELTRWGERLSRPRVRTVFLGGGTPTLLAPPLLEQLFGAIDDAFRMTADCEVTSEANPGTVDRDKFSVLAALGVNRLSIGVQSFQADELAFLGRIHSAQEAVTAFEAARAAGIDNINLDFMFGLPDQTPQRWRSTLDRALDLQPEHLSLYSLIVESNTPLHHWVETGQVTPVDEDQAADLYETAMESLHAAGYRHYEVSNWSCAAADDSELMPAHAARHNLIYWRNQEYLGIGPGAHSHLSEIDASGTLRSRRWGNRKSVPGYVRRVQRGENIVEFEEIPTAATSMGETMMLGLRLVDEGVDRHCFQARYGCDLTDVYAHDIAYLEANGLVELTAHRLRLTARGLMLGNQIFLRFLPETAGEVVYR